MVNKNNRSSMQIARLKNERAIEATEVINVEAYGATLVQEMKVGRTRQDIDL